MSRRGLLAAVAGGIGYALLPGMISADRTASGRQHKVWVWQFEHDAPPEVVRDVLAAHRLAVLFKTHDGDQWMGRFSKIPLPIWGAGEIGPLAQFFESAGVPFHAWCVVKGENPVREAEMCAETLSAGARSMTFDLEPREGVHYWQGDSEAALRFGRELRRLAPSAWLTVAPDPRPWQLEVVPIGEFASFCNEILPQTYWRTFNSSANHRLLAQRGYQLGPEGVTPELMLDVTQHALQRFGLPISPIGQGNADPDAWRRFISHARRLGMNEVSLWRFGTAVEGVLPVLQEMAPPQPEPPPAPTPTPTPASGLWNNGWQPKPAPTRQADDRRRPRTEPTPTPSATSTPRPSATPPAANELPTARNPFERGLPLTSESVGASDATPAGGGSLWRWPGRSR